MTASFDRDECREGVRRNRSRKRRARRIEHAKSHKFYPHEMDECVSRFLNAF